MKKANALLLIAAALLLGLIVSMPLTGNAANALSDLPKQVGAATENAVDYAGDAVLTGKIKTRFLAEKGLDSLDISVENQDGVVTLSGAVNNEAQISLAEKVAKEESGVKKVVNKLTLKKAQ